MSCNKVRAKLKSNNPSRATNSSRSSPRFNPLFLKGPGSALKYIFVTKYRAPGCGGCHKAAETMDEDGVDTCRADPEKYAQMIHDNAEGSKLWIKVLDFVCYARYGLDKYMELILEACDLHENEVRKQREYLEETPQ